MPFFELLFFRKLIIKKKRQIKTNDFILIGMLGAICLLTLIVIIKYELKIAVG